MLLWTTMFAVGIRLSLVYMQSYLKQLAKPFHFSCKLPVTAQYYLTCMHTYTTKITFSTKCNKLCMAFTLGEFIKISLKYNNFMFDFRRSTNSKNWRHILYYCFIMSFFFFFLNACYFNLCTWEEICILIRLPLRLHV